MEDDSGLPDDPEQLQVIIEESEGEVIRLKELIQIENDKMETYRVKSSFIY